MLKNRDERILDASGMAFLRHLLGITQLYREINQSIRDKLSVQNIVRDLQLYQQSGNNIYKELTQSGYPSTNLRESNLGHPIKRWKDQIHLEGLGTGTTRN